MCSPNLLCFQVYCYFVSEHASCLPPHVYKNKTIQLRLQGVWKYIWKTDASYLALHFIICPSQPPCASSPAWIALSTWQPSDDVWTGRERAMISASAFKPRIMFMNGGHWRLDGSTGLLFCDVDPVIDQYAPCGLLLWSRLCCDLSLLWSPLYWTVKPKCSESCGLSWFKKKKKKEEPFLTKPNCALKMCVKDLLGVLICSLVYFFFFFFCRSFSMSHYSQHCV